MTGFTPERRGASHYKDAMLEAIAHADELFLAVSDSMAGFVKDSCTGVGKDALEAGDTLVDIVAGVLDAVAGIGHDAAEAARGIALGALRGKRSDPGSVLTTLAVTSRSVVRHVARAGGDISAATAGLVAGAAEGAREAGMDVMEAVFAVSRGAIQGVRGFGLSADQKVRDAVAAMRELTRGREPGHSQFDEMEDTPMFFPGPMVE